MLLVITGGRRVEKSMSRCVQLVSGAFLSFLVYSSFWWEVRGTCLEHVRGPHTCRPQAPVPSRKAERGDPGGGPHSVAAFYLKEIIPIPVLGEAPGEAFPRHRAHLSHAPYLCR